MVLIPAIRGASGHGHHPDSRLRSNARGIYNQIFAAATENTGGRTNYWAATEPNTEFANYEPTSTEYFRWLMTPYDIMNPANGAEALQQDFSAFHAEGLLEIRDLSDLTPETNPWVVVADLSEYSTSGTPFMITRNINEIRLRKWDHVQTPLQNIGTGPFHTPFGGESLIVVRVGGGNEILNQQQLFWDILNPTLATNLILQP